MGHIFSSILAIFQHSASAAYWLVLLFSFIESLAFIGAAIPGTIFVVLAGFFSAKGYLNFGWLVVAAAIGATLGDNFSYWLGTKGTRFFKEEGRLLKRSHLDRGEAFFKKYGSKSIFLGRFIIPIRPVIPFVAGLSKMDKWRFLFWNVASAIIWALVHLTLGYFFGDAFSAVESWSVKAMVFFIIMILAAVLVRLVLKYFRLLYPSIKLLFVSSKRRLSSIAWLQYFVRRHQKTASFIKRRFSVRRFSGLPLTLLGLAAIYIFLVFLGLAEDIISAEPVVASDLHLASLLYFFRTKELIRIFLDITVLARWPTIIIFVLILSLGLWINQKKSYIIPLLATVIGASSFMALVKLIIHRPRPDLAYYAAAGFSFPSGHATVALAFYGFACYVIFRSYRSWRVKANALFVAVMTILGVGLSRLYLGVHYLSDVWGGYLLGSLWLIIGISLAEWSRQRQLKIPAQLSRRRWLATAGLVLIGLALYVVSAKFYNPPPVIHPAFQSWQQ